MWVASQVRNLLEASVGEFPPLQTGAADHDGRLILLAFLFAPEHSDEEEPQLPVGNSFEVTVE